MPVLIYKRSCYFCRLNRFLFFKPFLCGIYSFGNTMGGCIAKLTGGL